jgi:hypothetical protein
MKLEEAVKEIFDSHEKEMAEALSEERKKSLYFQ